VTSKKAVKCCLYNIDLRANGQFLPSPAEDRLAVGFP
jgi:hypothetical protein